MTRKNRPKKDGSGKGVRTNRGRGGCKRTSKVGKGKGWYNQPGRHALASKGVKTTVNAKGNNKNSIDIVEEYKKRNGISHIPIDKNIDLHRLGEAFAKGEVGTGWMATKPYKTLEEWDGPHFSDYPFDDWARGWTETLQFRYEIGEDLEELAKKEAEKEGNDEWVHYYTDLESMLLSGYSGYLRNNFYPSLKENIDKLDKNELENTYDALKHLEGMQQGDFRSGSDMDKAKKLVKDELNR